MPTTYAGYAPRRKGDEGTLDIGKAFGGAIETIKTAQKEEKERREKLTSIYDKNKQTIEGYAAGKSKGFNNWMQEQITKVAGVIAADFKLLKQGKTTDSDYRRKNTNINSGWSMLAKRAKGWNDHYAAGIKQVNSGEGSDYMAFMLGEDSKISDFAALDMFVQDDGNLVLAGIDDNGVVVPGSERALTTIMSPENSVDASLDAPAELQAMLKTLPEYSIKMPDGTKIIDPKLNRDFNAQRLLNAESSLQNPRDIAKWYSNLNEHKVKYFSNPNDRFSMVDTYMKSDVGINAVANRAKDLMADLSPAEAKDRAVTILSQATMEIEGEQHLLQVLSADDGNTTITQPQFGERGTFRIPAGGRPITIMVEKINPETGEVDTDPKTFQPGEEVNLGEMQYHKVKAQIYKQQSVRSGHQELGGRSPRQETPYQQDERLKKEAADKLLYEMSVNAANWNTQELVSASKGNIKSIHRMDNNKIGKDKRVYMLITKKGHTLKTPNQEKIDFPVKRDANKRIILDANGDPVLDIQKMASGLAHHIDPNRKASLTKASWRRGKALLSEYVAEEGEAKDIPKYSTVTGDRPATFSNKNYGYLDFITGTGKEARTKNSDEAMQVIIKEISDPYFTDANKAPVEHIKEFANVFGKIPKKAMSIDYKKDQDGDKDEAVLTVTSPYGETKEVKIITDSNKNDAVSAKANKEKMEEIFEFYYTRPVAPPPTSTKKIKVGDIKTGNAGKKYRFKGGDPKDKNNWEEV